MSGSSAAGPPPDAVNPFSPTAVANLMEFGGDTVTIETPVIRQAMTVTRNYLQAHRPGASAGETAREGEVLAVVGDYGSGKTHLAMRMLDLVATTVDVGTESGIRSVYLDANAGTFLSLYNRFVDKLEQGDLRERVRQYYSEIVTESLRPSPHRDELAGMLRANEIDPAFIADEFATGEAVLRERLRQSLQERLTLVTENPAFGTALALLLRPGFDDVVWEWLEGKPPDLLLRERGITTTIDTEATALEAMGVISMLYSGRDSRFVLVIDELDKVLATPESRGPAALGAFKQLLQVFVGAGALLVLSCLPDVLRILGKDIRDRIGHVVQMAPLTAGEVREFIEASQQAKFGEPRLAPFTEPTIDYIVALTRGLPRRIIRLCHETYRKAVEDKTPVTVDIVQGAAREQFEVATVEDVRDVVSRVLDQNGWRYTKNHPIGEDSASWVDFWITSGNPETGCAVLVVGPIFDADGVQKLTQRAIAIKAGAPDSETLLVVNGLLAVELETALGNSFGMHPLTYNTQSFVDNLTTAVRAMLDRLLIIAGGNPYDAVRERVEWINQQQANTHAYIEQLGVHVEAWRSSADRQLIAIQRELSDVSAAVRAADEATATGQGDVSHWRSASKVPVEVDRIFDEAIDVLDEFNRFDVLLRNAFGAGTDLEGESSARSAIRRGLRFSSNATGATGTAVLLQKAVRTFRDSITDWFRAYQLDDDGQPRQVDRDRLDSLCSTYDFVTEYLPFIKLDDVEELTSETSWKPDQITRAARRDYRERVADVLQEFSVRVRSAVLRQATTGH
jgi:Cdc6-like AAA superfamily ATPase